MNASTDTLNQQQKNQQQRHQQYHQQLLCKLLSALQQQAPFNSEAIEENEQKFLISLTALSTQLDASADNTFKGQELLCKIIANYSHLTPLVPRDLLWFFAGDCLHFMPDDEINCYQKLDEMRFEAESKGEIFNYEASRAALFKLH